MLEFGIRDALKVYRPRPGSYAVILDDHGRVAVLHTPKGSFLPGGGADPGESPETTLRREVLEECGHELSSARPLGHAVEYVDAGLEGCFAKECSFFQGRLGPFVTPKVEADHHLEWMPADDAARRLTYRSQAWAVRQALEQGSG